MKVYIFHAEPPPILWKKRPLPTPKPREILPIKGIISRCLKLVYIYMINQSLHISSVPSWAHLVPCFFGHIARYAPSKKETDCIPIEHTWYKLIINTYLPAKRSRNHSPFTTLLSTLLYTYFYPQKNHSNLQTPTVSYWFPMEKHMKLCLFKYSLRAFIFLSLTSWFWGGFPVWRFDPSAHHEH